MLEVFVANVFNTEVIDREVEPHGSCDMFEKAGSVRLLEITVWRQACFLEFVREYTGLWEAVHALANFHVDETVFDFWS